MKQESINTIPTPPFFGNRLIEAISLKAIIPFINKTSLFKFQWKFNAAQWPFAEKILDRLITENLQHEWISPQAIYGFYRCQSENNDLILLNEQNNLLCRFTFPRQTIAPNLCIADFFASTQSNIKDNVALQVVTIGEKASQVARDLYEQNQYQAYLYQRGFNAVITEALAEFMHKKIRMEWGFIDDEPNDIDELFKHHYRGARYSFGYSACPQLEDQEKILQRLQAERINIALTETYQLIPEETTTAIITHNPNAKLLHIELT